MSSMNTKAQFGQILEKNSLVMRYQVCEMGTDEEPEQFSFELANFNSPMIVSHKTGKKFILPLSQLLQMAIEAGIEEETS